MSFVCTLEQTCTAKKSLKISYVPVNNHIDDLGRKWFGNRKPVVLITKTLHFLIEPLLFNCRINDTVTDPTLIIPLGETQKEKLMGLEKPTKSTCS